MTSQIEETIKRTIIEAVQEKYDVTLDDIMIEHPPNPAIGDLAITVAFDLARKARLAPRKIAEELATSLSRTLGIHRVDVAGPGYLNVFLDRTLYTRVFTTTPSPSFPSKGKVIVEHTNINPNKAAHIGHLRNAALGDTFVRVLRYLGEEVEVQNYIDDTGVQVADVVAGFLYLENKSLLEIRELARKDGFDYYCWDLYASVSDYFRKDQSHLNLRADTLKAIEEGTEPEAPIAACIAEHIVLCHLRTMQRINVHYDLLPWEGDILRLRFWERAYELLKDKQAIRLADTGKNSGCWVMDLVRGKQSLVDQEQNEKVIVRSNGTVTYVGKDIAYQMWKLGLLDREFMYRRFHNYSNAATAWSTTTNAAEDGAPAFGHGQLVYNVIDARQSYLQQIVRQGVTYLASEDARERSRHFSYEMVALTPSTCRELGFPVSDEEATKPYLEVSGRKGLGVKADDLLQTLEKKALTEVKERNPELTEIEKTEIARELAVGALRYFMIKVTKNQVIAFDFDEALNWKGDSGPYLQYASVRAGRILEKMDTDPNQLLDLPVALRGFEGFSNAMAGIKTTEANELWALLFSAMRLTEVAQQVRRTEEPAHLARHAFRQAQRFNAFYHVYHITREDDPVRQALRLYAVQIFQYQQLRALESMGIPVPARM